MRFSKTTPAGVRSLARKGCGASRINPTATSSMPAMARRDGVMGDRR